MSTEVAGSIGLRTGEREKAEEGAESVGIRISHSILDRRLYRWQPSWKDRNQWMIEVRSAVSNALRV